MVYTGNETNLMTKYVISSSEFATAYTHLEGVSLETGIHSQKGAGFFLHHLLVILN